jgi:hypothetical protein
MGKNTNAAGKKRTNHKRGIKRAMQEQRHKDAEIRNAKYRALSPQERLDALNKRLGPGVGAARERARLASQIAAPKVSAPNPNPMDLANKAGAAALDVAAKQKRAAKQAKKEAAARKKQDKP